ncbi:MAG: hypothetical protein H6678_06610 [Candidatus Delongbacteria bacterium]|nr:hypothetical protein [Candidatus Cloacimonadota bacterium]MCB9473463.1 hypothetical protein [Candidatus Delongbacteria bacterium]
MAAITTLVQRARSGDLPQLICALPSGWAVMGESQVLRGYCLLLPDPVVPNLNALQGAARLQYLEDMARLGDAVLTVTGALRINYEILGNVDPELHAHVIPRFADEAEELRLKPIWFHDWAGAPRFSPEAFGELQEGLRRALDSVIQS